ncbi:DUF5130 domain-containing protein [Hoyosella altamirensis]|uniref:DUF5130 domain-containing protein n=1 Tax=Hoyosella altamirensis TaxID=616997 RepID=A0A839RSD5_9ACTN|nr:DUF5130 domain-containing protein [Hoyosella altamirensis]MBB3039118.1 hypothetical protein [Hoyosella altamirensis]
MNMAMEAIQDTVDTVDTAIAPNPERTRLEDLQVQRGEILVPAAPVVENLPLGAAQTSSGRISAVRFLDEPVEKLPFDKDDLIRLDDALTFGTRTTGVKFTIYLGELGDNANDRAFDLLDSLDDPDHSALIAVSPGERKIEVVSGAGVVGKVGDRICQLGVTAAVPAFREGKLIDGLVAAVKVMSAAARPVGH